MRRSIVAALKTAAARHMTDAMAPLRARLDAAMPPDGQVDRFIAAAPVIFAKRLFDHPHPDADPQDNAKARPAIVAAMPTEFGGIDDVAAFEAEAPFRIARLLARNPALGHDAIFDARLHERARVKMHANIWTWLQADGAGLLPIDWRWAALELKRRGVEGVIAPDLAQGREIERRLKAALKPPAVFVAAGQPQHATENEAA